MHTPELSAPLGHGEAFVDDEVPSRARRLDPAARSQLILKYYPMVRRVAYRMVSRFPSCVDVDDLINIGVMGLIDAVDRYESDRGVTFAGYARIRVQGAIVDEMRKNDWVPRSVRDRGERIRVAREALAVSIGREPSDRELALHMGVSEDRLKELMGGSAIVSLVSIEEGREADHPLAELIADLAETPEDAAQSCSLSRRVAEALASLTERDRRIVELYYFREQGFADIGRTLGVTESRISQLHTRIMARLREKLAAVAAGGR
jgi:RNA polymerase sigma factor for flagellar operon FliA